MNNKIVWVAGSSAVGKETFIKHVVNNKPTELIKRLSWEDYDITYSQESIEHVVLGEGDGNKENRESLADDIIFQVQHSENKVILVKWQDLDYGNQHLLNVRNTLSEDVTEIIFLHTDLETIYQRVQTKVWWSEDYMSLDDAIRYIQKQIDFMLEYQNLGVPLISLHSDDSQTYQQRKFPPDLISDYNILKEKLQNNNV